ncbi:hypothetical protein [Mycobacterium avium]|jgi:hypothetical protein|uniref:hypothetical protein n=1 Tax=Mycobacterium avium TaxID=1764 RepID=UPI0007A0061F|nr:hypothetical protein [Mycobacterium avium]MBZ4522626.1 hypothetical protein [Mycobacterium avium subsp. hominissuis]MBZ4532834.1 hypothetical protein [Mycobacterium avium subsp. hominissuis]
MTSFVYGLLTVIGLVLALVFASIAAVFIKRLGDRATTSTGEQVGGAKTVVTKVRKRQPMSQDELNYAKRLLADRSSVLALCLPGALFSIGCFYVFGSLYHLHGATPSERTFLGVFPMFASTNLTIQILRSARLKRRLQKMS